MYTREILWTKEGFCMMCTIKQQHFTDGVLFIFSFRLYTDPQLIQGALSHVLPFQYKMYNQIQSIIIIIKLDCKCMPELTVTKLKLKMLSCNFSPVVPVQHGILQAGFIQ